MPGITSKLNKDLPMNGKMILLTFTIHPSFQAAIWNLAQL